MPDKKPIVFQFQPHDAPISADKVLQEGEETVLMLFPRRVLLTLDSRQVVEFLPGPQEVPASLADHPYLKAHGVKRHTKAVPITTKLPVLTEEHMDYIHARGYSIKSVEDANKFFQNMSADQRTTFLFDYAEFSKSPKRPNMAIGSSASQVIADASAGMPPASGQASADGDQALGKDGEDADGADDVDGGNEAADANQSQQPQRRQRRNQQKKAS